MDTSEAQLKVENGEGEPETKLDPKVERYVQELLTEKQALDPSSHALRLIQTEIDRTLASGKNPFETRFVDLYHERRTKVSVKVLVPVKEHPKFNFIGKILGPKGNTLKRLQEDTQCRMAVLGRGSIREKEKEDEYRASLDPKFAHLSDMLHVEVSSLASPAEAYARLAYGLAELRKFLIPDTNDEIAQQQQIELGYAVDPNSAPAGQEFKPPNMGASRISGPPSFNDNGGGRGAQHASRGSFQPRGSGAGGVHRGAPRGGFFGRGARGSGPARGGGGGAPRGGGGAPRGGASGGQFGAARSFDGPAPRGGGRGRGPSRGMSRGSPRGGPSSRGFGAPQQRRPVEDDSFYMEDDDENAPDYYGGGNQDNRGGSGFNADFGGYNAGREFTPRNSGGGFNAGATSIDSGSTDFQRRSTMKPNDYYGMDDAPQGQWKPRGGATRYGAERPTPYSRR